MERVLEERKGEAAMAESKTVIDMKKTGQKLQNLTRKYGYSVKDLQYYLGLSCPQPIYRWFKGSILPSVDNLLRLSELLHIHMEDLLVKKEQKNSPDIFMGIIWKRAGSKHEMTVIKRVEAYYNRMAA